MKKIYSLFLFIVCFFISLSGLRAQTFTVGSASGNLALNCNTTVITMTTNSGYIPYSYTWTAPGNTLYGNYANISVAGTWTVFGQSQTSTVSSQQTFIITQSVQAPTIVITPTINNITCAGGSGCFTITSNLSPNVTTNWFIVQGTNNIYVGIPQGTINIFCAAHPGVYWGESVNNLTGCKSTKSVQVTASVGVPIFSLSSPTNFSLGCGSSSCTSIQVPTCITSPVPNVPVNYAFVPPPATATPVYGNSPNQNACIPGSWVVYVKDMTNNCVSSIQVSVIQNTTQPSAYVSQPLSMVNCFQQSMVLTGISSNTNTTINWAVPSSSVVNSSTVIAVTNSAIAGSTANITSTGIYTLSVTDNITQCVGTKTLSIMQDVRLPKFTISALTNSVITCNDPSVTIVPVITPTLAVSLVPTYTWFAPISSGVAGTSFTTTIPGTHTAISMSSVNGCTYSATFMVAADNWAAVGGPFGVSCPFTTVVLTPTVAWQFNSTYTWSPSSGITSALNQPTVSINALGNYTCIVSNTVNGCVDTVVYNVVCSNGLQSLTSNDVVIYVYPNPSKGNLSIELSVIDPTIKFSIFDLQGKMILERLINSKRSVIETGLQEGCYFYKITSGEMVLKRDKLLIE